MTDDVEKLQNLSDYKGSHVVVTANNSKLLIAHVGSAIVSPQSSDDEVPLQNVYHVPGMKKNLLLVEQLTSSGHFVLFGPHDVKVYRDLEIIEEPVMKGQRLESDYVLSAKTAYVDKARRNETADLWHMRLCHVSYSKLNVMMKKSMLKGLPQIEVRIDTVCAGCQYGKAHQLSFEESKFKAKEPLELIHSDVIGPARQASIGGMKYMVTFIDDFSSSQISFENAGYTISSQALAHHSNGVAERKNRHLAKICRSILLAKNVPGRFWAKAMRTATFVINRLPQQRLSFLSPFEKIWSTKPTVSYFKVFGCVCYVFVPDHLRSKMDKKAVRCIFVGYDNQRKGWRCCDPVTRKCYTSRNVVFDEASSWWSSDKEVLPDSNVFKEALESSQIHLSLYEVDGTVDEGNAEEDVAQNPWQTGVYQQPSEEGDSSGVETPLLRRSTRMKKPNPNGYSVAPADSSLFVTAIGRKLAIVLVYVDDLILTGDCEEEILQTKENLSIHFLMKELGQLNHFLGLEIDRSEEGIFLYQQNYSKDLLKKFGMLNCKPISTPMEPNAKMCAHEGKDLKEETIRYMKNPKKLHLEAVRGILRYVKGTLDYGIIYKKGGDCKLVGFCDADYAESRSFFEPYLLVSSALREMASCSAVGALSYLQGSWAGSKLCSKPIGPNLLWFGAV
ncbi:hypothetical protein RJ639_039680 [Escallonia herrerae]|uniref:Polyprotein n=1 Tax=Escallonia herrerae TaxID=1293975 RepID=A0AA88WPI6_9ASTE|nr:hypothetical protein RJ639_039680 [Escallonia herrerae]